MSFKTKLVKIILTSIIYGVARGLVGLIWK